MQARGERPIAHPDQVAGAARDLASIGSTINEANAAAAGQTTSVLAAGADEVSAAVAAVFGAHAEGYQVLSTQAAAFHQQFVQALTAVGLFGVGGEGGASGSGTPGPGGVGGRGGLLLGVNGDDGPKGPPSI